MNERVEGVQKSGIRMKSFDQYQHHMLNKNTNPVLSTELFILFSFQYFMIV